jgi:hypothetical protein
MRTNTLMRCLRGSFVRDILCDVFAYGSVCRDVNVHDLPVFLNRFISGSRSRRRKRKIPLVLIFPALLLWNITQVSATDLLVRELLKSVLCQPPILRSSDRSRSDRTRSVDRPSMSSCRLNYSHCLDNIDWRRSTSGRLCLTVGRCVAEKGWDTNFCIKMEREFE